MANPQNLRSPWAKGESGNPAGHSQDRRLTDALIQQIDRNPANCEQLVTVALDLALSGNFQMWKTIFDMIDGPVKTGTRAPRKPRG